MDAAILPLAITMMAGPQILSAIIFVTSENPVRVSLAYIGAVGITTAATVFVWTVLAGALGDGVSLRESSEPTTASMKAYLGRETSEPPKWMGKLQGATPARAFALGVLLIALMPSDFVIEMTTGVHLESEGQPFSAALPFIGLTALIAALPLLFYLLFRRRAEVLMPKVRDWMNANSWLVNIAVYALFIVLILA
jgi:Sap, sulfolipid-1-addressing protein